MAKRSAAAVETFTVHGEHRSLALAERHAAALRREHQADRVDIVARRNADGRFSKHGRAFTFKVTKKKKKGKKAEFAVSADYRARKGNSSVTVQIAAIGPENATKAQAEAATIHKIGKGFSPKGWQVRIVDWRGEEYTGGAVNETEVQRQAWSTLGAPLSLAELQIHKVGTT